MTISSDQDVGAVKTVRRRRSHSRDSTSTVAEGEVVGLPRAERRGQDHADPPAAGAAGADRAADAEIFGMDCHRHTVEVHRRLAYVPGETSLWPSLTGAETLHLLGRIHGRVDARVPATSSSSASHSTPRRRSARTPRATARSSRSIAALMSRADLLILDEPTSGLDPLMEQAFRLSIHEARERGQSVLLVVARPERGRGAVRPDRDPPRRAPRRDGHARRHATPVRAHRRGDVRGDRSRRLARPGRLHGRGPGTDDALPGARRRRAAPARCSRRRASMSCSVASLRSRSCSSRTTATSE